MNPTPPLPEPNPDTLSIDSIVADFEAETIVSPPGTKPWPRPQGKPRPAPEEWQTLSSAMIVEFEGEAILAPSDEADQDAPGQDHPPSSNEEDDTGPSDETSAE